MNRVIFVLVDALGYETAVRTCGFLEHLTECGKIAKYRMQGELPSLSRPMYATLLTGLPAWQHGIVSNDTVCHCRKENVFSITRQAGLTNACAGYRWLSELFGNSEGVFDLSHDRFQMNGTRDIMHGIFYQEDEYPDSHLYADAEYLRGAFRPDFLMIHPMGVDSAGHRDGAESRLYEERALTSGELIALYWERWVSAGYQVVVTADHGMSQIGLHGGNAPIQRMVPLYICSERVRGGDWTDQQPVSSLDVAPLLLMLLGLRPAAGMRQSVPMMQA